MAASTKSHDFLGPPTQSGDLGTLGHYRVIDELGRGGMGFVFRAEDIKLKRAVALKVMNQRIAATPNSRRRFIHEARAMAAVHHDNVATIFEVGESNGTPFMAMEMLKGSTVEEFNKAKQRLGFEKIIEYARQIACGLAAAHARGIVHRDIKPANIWIEEGKDRIKILDFGLALASTPVDHLAGRGAVIGTPGYLSPEQARSEPLDDRSDLYSMGVVLYELCTGKLPIQAKSVPGQLISILAHRPKPIHEINPEIPQPLCVLVHRLLRKEPRSRPSSAVALQEELDRVETECHAKSEVAQAINKLQMGLSEVVSKSADSGFFEAIDEFQSPIPDPLATIPAPVTMVTPARPAAQKATAAAAPAWQAYWPFAAIGAVVLIALPVLTFAFSGIGRDEAYVIAQSDSEPTTATRDPAKDYEKTSQKPTGGNNQAQQSRQQNSNGSPSEPKGSGQGKTGQNRQGNKKRNQNRSGGEKNDQATSNPSESNGGDDKRAEGGPAKQDGGVNSPAEANLTSVATEPMSAPVASVAESTPQPEPEPPTIEMKWTSISTAEGRGADVMVQKAGSQKFGSKPSFGIGTRGKVETHHSYLQFDLANIGNLKKHIQSAELILTLLGGRDQPTDLAVRVYGVTDVGVWEEEVLTWNKSFSAKGIESFPLIAELRASVDSLQSFEGKKYVRISTPELAKFVAAAGESVTFVMAGSGTGDGVVRFISRDNATGPPPTLRLETPRDAPLDDRNNNRNRNNRRR